MRRARRCISSLKEDTTDRKGSPGIIHSRDRMDRREDIMMIDGEGVRGLWRQCWLVWRVVVVWMLVCCFKALGGTGRMVRMETHTKSRF
jgi:hypothetical protein